MEKANLSFTKGMNTDFDKSVRSQETYLLSENFTSSSIDSTTIGSLEVSRGNKLLLTLPEGAVIIGHAFVKDTLVVFTHSVLGGSIVKYTIDGNTIGLPTIVYSDISKPESLGFTSSSKIDAIGRYESATVQKVYWADSVNNVRSINIVDDNSGRLPSDLDLVPNFSQGNITISSIVNGGNIKAGNRQYAYRLFTKNGSQTCFSVPSNMLAFTEDTVSGIGEFTGTDYNLTTKKSARISITGINTSFDYIRVYAIHYSAFNTPTIELVLEEAVTDSDMTLVDTGNILDTITLEEFNAIGDTNFKAKTLTSKNNILLAANIEEDTFDLDIDCRAYRFNNEGSSPVAHFYDSDGTHYQLFSQSAGIHAPFWWQSDTATGEDWSIPIDADCINRYNDEFLQTADNYNNLQPVLDRCLYQYNGTTIGGSGPIVSYAIELDATATTLAADAAYTEVTNSNLKFVLSGDSHKCGETYRYGIEFYDKKGKPYFVKWVGDIRMPYEDVFTMQATSGGQIDANKLNIKFTVDLTSSHVPAGFVDKVSGFRIVRVQRTEEDRSIVAQGYTWRTKTNTTGDGKASSHYCLPYAGPSSTLYENSGAEGEANGPYDYIHPLYSPELFFNKGIKLNGEGYRAKISGIYGKANRMFLASSDTISFQELPSVVYSSSQVMYLGGSMSSIAPSGSYPGIKIGCSFTLADIANAYSSEKDVAPMTLSAGSGYKTDYPALGTTRLSFRNRVVSDGASNYTMYGPTCGVFTTNVRLHKGLPTSVVDALTFRVDIYRDNATTRYGGNTYSSRTRNAYIGASDFVQVTTEASYSCYSKGDVYLSVFDHMTSMCDTNEADDMTDDVYNAPGDDYVKRRQICSMLPVESSINCTLANIKPSKYALTTAYASGANELSSKIGIQETTALGVSHYGDKYPIGILTDLYTYNTAYSSVTAYPVYYSKPYIDNSTTSFKFTIKASEKKENGELVDNWTIFKAANYIDADPAYGAINALGMVDNKVFFWQDYAFGTVAVNDRYIINEGMVGQLALGTGGILERYDYISILVGAASKKHITSNENEIVWYNYTNKKLYSFRGELIELSTSLGVNIFVRKYAHIDPIAVTDFVNNEMLIKLSNNYTLVYDLLTKSITGVYTYTPGYFISMSNGNIISFPSDNKAYAYIHNIAEASRATYYGTTYNSKIITVCNQGYNEVKVFDTLDWHSDSMAINSITEAHTFNVWASDNDDTRTVTGINTRVELALDRASLYDEFADHNQVAVIQYTSLDSTGYKYLTITPTADDISDYGGADTVYVKYYTPLVPSGVTANVFTAPLVHNTPYQFEFFLGNNTGFVEAGFLKSNGDTFTAQAGAALTDTNQKVITNDTPVNVYDDTFDSYRITNDYQNTDWQTISWRRKERNFNTVVPRDRVTAGEKDGVDIFDVANLDSDQLYKRRIVDRYINIELVKDNTKGYVFSFPYINVNYRKSYR